MASTVSAAPIPVPNGDFENWQAIGDGGTTNAGWASVPSGQTPATNVGRSDEMWTNPASFGSGWTNTGLQGTNGKWGLQHPSATQHQRATVPGPLTGPHFSGNFIGFVNLDTPADTDDAPIADVQSATIGQLAAGTYTLRVAIGMRAGATWNDTLYQASLITGMTPSAEGTTGGVDLGIPASRTLVAAGATVGSNQEILEYVLDVPLDSPLIGQDYAIRLHLENPATQGGTPNLDNFTQANFDNVTLDFVAVPEPASLGVLALAALAALNHRPRGRR